MPLHDVTASTVMLAKSWLLTLDRKALNTTVPTATLELWLRTLVDLGTPAANQGVADGAARTVMGHAVRIGEAEKAR